MKNIITKRMSATNKIIITVILVGIFIGGAIFLIENNKLQFEREKEELRIQQEKLNSQQQEDLRRAQEAKDLQAKLDYADCKDEAYVWYTELWVKECKKIGRGANCKLPLTTANGLDESLETEYDECDKLHL
jgi:hypothetical protein